MPSQLKNKSSKNKVALHRREGVELYKNIPEKIYTPYTPNLSPITHAEIMSVFENISDGTIGYMRKNRIAVK